MNVPTGVIMICVDPAGREIATVHDFSLSGHGGFTLQRSQEIRCKKRLACAVIDAYSNPIIAKTLSEWHRDELLNKLISEQGYKVHTVFLPEDLRENSEDE